MQTDRHKLYMQRERVLLVVTLEFANDKDPVEMSLNNKESH